MKWYIQVSEDTKPSACVCRTEQQMAETSGGVELTEEEIRKGLSDSRITGLFHKNCRCHVYPAKASLTGNNFIDGLVKRVGALRYLAEVELHRDKSIPQDVKDLYSKIKGKYV